MLKKTTLAKLAAIYSIIAVLSLNFGSSFASAISDNIEDYAQAEENAVEEKESDELDGGDVTENAQADANSNTNPTVDTNTSPLPHYTGYEEPGMSTMRDKPNSARINSETGTSRVVLDPKTDSYVMVEEDGFTQYNPTTSEFISNGASRAGKQALEAFKSVKIWVTGASKSKESSADSEEVNRHQGIPQNQKLEYIYVDQMNPDMKGDGYTATAIENTVEGMSPYNPTASE
jgi:hypothetical protein